MNLKSLSPVVLAASFAALFLACSKDATNVELAPHTADYAFPLFSTSLNTTDLFSQLLSDSSSTDALIFHPDKTITLIYSGDVAEKPASDIFNFLKDIPPVPLVDSVVAAPSKVPNGVDLHYALLKGGTVQAYAWNTTIPEPLTLTISAPQLTKGGQPLLWTFNVNPGLAFIWTTYPAQPQSLAGYELTSQDDSIYFYSTWKRKDGSILYPAPGPIAGAPPAILYLKDLEFKYVQGHWGYQLYPLTRDTIEIDINKSNLKGNITVKDPKVTMTVLNSWGFPTRGKIKYLSFIGRDGVNRELKSTILDTAGVDWDWPQFIKNEVGQTKVTHFVFDGSNSNIAAIFNSQPVRLVYEIDGISNAENDLNLVGFITDSSTLKFAMKVELLLEGTAQNFASNDTLNLSFGDLDDLDPLEYEDAEFKLVTENEMPMGASLQLYFLDNQGVRTDSLFQNGQVEAIKAAPVDANGRATEAARVETFIPMTVARFNKIKDAKRAYVQLYFSTTDNGQKNVKLLADANLRLKMGLRVRKKFQ